MVVVAVAAVVVAVAVDGGGGGGGGGWRGVTSTKAENPWRVLSACVELISKTLRLGN